MRQDLLPNSRGHSVLELDLLARRPGVSSRCYRWSMQPGVASQAAANAAGDRHSLAQISLAPTTDDAVLQLAGSDHRPLSAAIFNADPKTPEEWKALINQRAQLGSGRRCQR